MSNLGAINVLIETAQKVDTTVEELTKRIQRHYPATTLFEQGLVSAWVQAISLLTGITFHEVYIQTYKPLKLESKQV